jgi:YegS/Rv2252/BmrU family lipid kinase
MWLETTRHDPGRGQTRRAIDAGVTTVVAMGGDGTVMACADTLVGTDVALGVIPMGTGNLLAGNLGIPPRLTEAVAAVATGRRRQLDVGIVDGRCFAVMAGMGFDAQMLHDAPAALKARIGWAAYGAAALRHLCGVPMNVTVQLDDDPPIHRRARAVLVGNVGGLPGGLRLLPDAEPDDGILDVAILMPARRRNWLTLAWALVRRRRIQPAIETFRATHVTVISDRPQPRELDGDLIEPSDRLTATVCPAALWVCVPCAFPS